MMLGESKLMESVRLILLEMVAESIKVSQPVINAARTLRFHGGCVKARLVHHQANEEQSERAEQSHSNFYRYSIECLHD